MFYMSLIEEFYSEAKKVKIDFQVPLFNLAVSGIFSAIIALFFDLEKLVEFMSIGTLLAYTIVSACVIILRYKTTLQEQFKGGEDVSVSTVSMQSDNLYLPPTEKLRPEFWWLSHIVSGCNHNKVISGSVLVFIFCSALLCAHLHFFAAEILLGGWWAIFILIFLILCVLGCLLVIGAHRQTPSTNTFRVPWVPFIPGLSILCNVGLMVHLNILTWVRFTVWMTLGLLVYFLYGIKHSKEGNQINTYSMLITSSEAHKEPWGTINQRDNVTKKNKGSERTETPITTIKKFLGTSKQKEEKTALTADDEDDH